jgi:hypothetical protein
MKTILKHRISRRRGWAIGSVMSLIVLLLVLGMGMLTLSLRAETFAMRSNDEIVARCAADAGLAKVLNLLNQEYQGGSLNDVYETYSLDGDIVWQGTRETLPNCDGSFSYSVSLDADWTFPVTVTGESGQAQKTINCSLKLEGPFEYSVLTRGDIILKAGTTVSGYNSSDLTDPDTSARIATMSTDSDSITLNMGVTISGTVYVGVDGRPDTVIKDLGATTGPRFAMSEEPPLPQVVVPALTDYSSDLAAQGETITVTPAESGIYDSIELKKAALPGILEIAGGDVVLVITDDIQMGQNCEIVINEGSSLTLYLAGNLNADNNSGFNNRTNIPGNLMIFGTSSGSQQMDVKAKSAVFGAVYAPNADIIVYAAGDVYGSFVASDFELKSDGNFYYDRALKDYTDKKELLRFVLNRWQE